MSRFASGTLGVVRSLVLLAGVARPWPCQAGAAPGALAWELLEQGAPRLVWATRTTEVRVRLRNVGTATWSEDAGDHLSYHWLDRAGHAVVFDGLRTVLPAAVRPGEVVEVAARLQGPEAGGLCVLRWEMVREQVAWYGPPTRGHADRAVVVLWRSRVAQVGLGVSCILAALALRRVRPSPGSAWWGAVALLPVVWTWLAALLVTRCFAELAGRQLEPGGLAVAASGAALVALPVALLPLRWRAWGAATVVALLGVITLADCLYMRYFGRLVPLAALREARQLGQVRASVEALLASQDLWLFAMPLLGLALAFLLPRPRSGDALSPRVRIATFAGGAVACLLGAWPAVATLASALHDPTTSGQVFSQQMLVDQWGVINVHAFDVCRTVGGWLRGDALSPQEQERVVEFYRRRAAAAPAAGVGFGAARGSNLLLIQVESLQEWVVGARIGGAEVTPFLDSLRGRALFFPHVFDQTGDGRTSDAEYAVLNSQLPLDDGAVAFTYPDDHFFALGEVLRRHGYATLSAHPFDRGFWNRAALHPRYGFQRSLFRHELGEGETIGWGLADGAFFTRMEPELEGLPRPFFAFLITLGLHHPFDGFPDRHKVLDVGHLKDKPLGNYIHAMHYFDDSLRVFLSDLDRRGVLRDTVVALYGDHDAGLEVDADLLALARQGGWDPSVLVRLRRVPLLVLLPGQALEGEPPVVGGHVDIAPTLLYLLGIARPPSFLGEALKPGRHLAAVLNDGSVVDHDRLFVASGPLIPSQGACFAFPAGAPLPLDACDALTASARAEQRASQAVVAHDLVPVLLARLGR